MGKEEKEVTGHGPRRSPAVSEIQAVPSFVPSMASMGPSGPGQRELI